MPVIPSVRFFAPNAFGVPIALLRNMAFLPVTSTYIEPIDDVVYAFAKCPNLRHLKHLFRDICFLRRRTTNPIRTFLRANNFCAVFNGGRLNAVISFFYLNSCFKVVPISSVDVTSS